jgi:hypothetical protein
MGLAERFQTDPDARPVEDTQDCSANGGSELDPGEVDYQAYSCENPTWTVTRCSTVEGLRNEPSDGVNTHIQAPEPIAYEANPPTHGAHRPQWGRWGEYMYLPPQRWIHNMEHGGVVALYHPCAPASVVLELRELMRDFDGMNQGEFRWILTPYPDLKSTLAIVAWQWVYQAPEFREDEVRHFVEDHYNMGPEDVGPHGGYDDRWLGK